MKSEEKFTLGVVAGGNYEWCLVIVVTFMGFGQIEAKRCGDTLKLSIGVAMHVTKEESSHMEGVFSLYNTAALKFFIISFTAG